MDNKMVCGHEKRFVVMSDEGTGWCMACELEGRMAQRTKDEKFLKILMMAAIEQRKKYAVDSKAFEMGMDTPTGENAHSMYERLTEAIEWAKKEIEH